MMTVIFLIVDSTVTVVIDSIEAVCFYTTTFRNTWVDTASTGRAGLLATITCITGGWVIRGVVVAVRQGMRAEFQAGFGTPVSVTVLIYTGRRNDHGGAGNVVFVEAVRHLETDAIDRIEGWPDAEFACGFATVIEFTVVVQVPCIGGDEIARVRIV